MVENWQLIQINTLAASRAILTKSSREFICGLAQRRLTEQRTNRERGTDAFGEAAMLWSIVRDDGVEVPVDENVFTCSSTEFCSCVRCYEPPRNRRSA